jgi:hypothetical protein
MAKPAKPSKTTSRNTAARKTARASARAAPPDPTSDESLLALAVDYADAPDIPVEIARRELSSLVRLAKRCGADLARVGIGPDTIELAARFVTVLAHKQKFWERVRKGVVLKATVRKLLAEAEHLDAKLVAAGRWALRRDPAAQAELTRIADGSGLVDTIQDLRDLQVFWEEHAEHLGSTLVTKKDLARAGALAEILEPAAEKEAAELEATQAQVLRNRAFWAAHELAQDIREGGRYAYATNPKMAAKFVSRHRAATVRRSRSKGNQGLGSATPAVTTESAKKA